MEFIDGRIFEDPSMPGVSAEGRMEMWRDAARTLAKLHRVDFRAVGLEDLGKSHGFYHRQLATWKQISNVQERAIDVNTKQPVGEIPHFKELSAFFADKKLQPRDRATLVHGDYKIDNLVFHKTEPKVVGILDWEMGTIGHPLSDVVGLLFPFFTDGLMPGSPQLFLDVPGLPSPEDLLGWYAEEAGWGYDVRVLDWAVAFGVFRAAAILQGIAARQATGQGNSEQAARYVAAFRPAGEKAWEMIRRLKGVDVEKGQVGRTKL